MSNLWAKIWDKLKETYPKLSEEEIMEKHQDLLHDAARVESELEDLYLSIECK